jgi:hypothetical protein
MANPRLKHRRYDLWDILLILAILPGIVVGAAVYGFNFDPMRVIAWFIGGDSRQLWHYFWWYVLGAVALVV